MRLDRRPYLTSLKSSAWLKYDVNVETTNIYKWNKYSLNVETTYEYNIYPAIPSYKARITSTTTYESLIRYWIYSDYSVDSNGNLSTGGHGVGVVNDPIYDPENPISGYFINSNTGELNYYDGTTRITYLCEAYIVYESYDGTNLLGTIIKNNRYLYGYYDDKYHMYNRTIYTYSKGSTYYGTVTSTNASEYPQDNYKGSYWYTYNSYSTSSVNVKGTNLIEIVRDTNYYKYPDNAYYSPDGCWYVRIDDDTYYLWDVFNAVAATSTTYYWNMYNVNSTATGNYNHHWGLYNVKETLTGYQTIHNWDLYNIDSDKRLVTTETVKWNPYDSGVDMNVYESYSIAGSYPNAGILSSGNPIDPYNARVGQYAEIYYGDGTKKGIITKAEYVSVSYPGISSLWTITVDIVTVQHSNIRQGSYITSLISSSANYYTEGICYETRYGYSWFVYNPKSEPIYTYSKGSTFYGYVTSTSRNHYSDNGPVGSITVNSNGTISSSSRWTVYSHSESIYTYSKGSTLISTVSSTSSSTYPTNGKSGSYWYVYSHSSKNNYYVQGTALTSNNTVYSTNIYAYPSNGYQNGYWYVMR